MAETFYITTPIYYANSKPHIGHAYTTMVADSITRFKRQRGIDTFFLTGTDEHGINIERAAAERGIPIKEHVDEIFKEFQKAFAPLGIELRPLDSHNRPCARKRRAEVVADT